MRTKRSKISAQSFVSSINNAAARMFTLHTCLLGILLLLNVEFALAGGKNVKPLVDDNLAAHNLEKSDFYQHVNGAWITSGGISEGEKYIRSMVKSCVKNSKNQDSNIVKLYKSYINTGPSALTKSKNTLAAKIDEVDSMLKDKSDLPVVIANLNTIKVNPLMSINLVQINENDGGDPEKVMNRALLEPPVIGAPETISQYYDAANIPVPGMGEIDGIIIMERTLKARINEVKSVNFTRYSPQEFERLIARDANFPAADAKREINYNFNEYWGINQKNPSANFLVNNPNYFVQLNKLLGSFSLPSLSNYLQYKILQEYARMIQPLKNRDDGVVSIDFVAAKLNSYVFNVCFPSGDSTNERDRANAIALDITKAYRSLIDNQPDIQEITKARLKEKLESLTFKFGEVGYNTHDMYTRLQLSADNLVDNLMKINNFDYTYMLEKINKPRCLEDISIGNLAINAIYCPAIKVIATTPLILREPFIADSEEDSYAGLGFIIAHEIGHALDDPNLWVADIKFFNDVHKKLEKQYAGLASMSEPWADNIGLSAAYRAYQMNLNRKVATKDQKRYIQSFYTYFTEINGRELSSDGDGNYPPIKIRINNVLKSQDAFYDGFDFLKPGDEMYLLPADRAQVFIPIKWAPEEESK